MPSKTTKSGGRYTVDGKKFVWTTDEGAEVTIPLRIKLKVLRSLADKDVNDVTTMFALLEQIAPDQADALDEQDVNDFQDMFTTWQREYNAMTGASLGESSGSSN